MTAGVLALHPWWGLNDDVRAYAERLRGEGYQVVAPDLYHGRVATTIEAAKALQGPLSKDWKRAMSEIEEAHTKLSSQADRVAVLAWSMGVWFSWQLAQAHPDRIRGLVSYYGYGEVEPGKPLPPILGHFAENDEFEALDDVQAIEKTLAESGAVAQFHVYPGTKHWFDEPSRPEYDKAASDLAWQRTLAFLDAHLRH
ncbi:MAG: dienelactone hydrolase family protein [Chloroflexota bacterium]|nr:dienelactone hydrolase family protein [Chloroflexota bacterium]